MVGAKTENYNKVLLAFKQPARKHNVVLEPDTITCDFEGAQAEALRDAFPAAALQGCGVHYRRAVLRNWRKEMQKTKVKGRLGSSEKA